MRRAPVSLWWTCAAVSIHAPARGATIPTAKKRRRATVSIHAPARGATVPMGNSKLGKMVSIHAPARGATLADYYDRNRLTFQFTHPRGVRRILERNGIDTNDVSIHAPARGATNPKFFMQDFYGLFQFTHPRGVRLLSDRLHARRCCFNSRTREGCDTPSTSKLKIAYVSIHAPARGATF